MKIFSSVNTISLIKSSNITFNETPIPPSKKKKKKKKKNEIKKKKKISVYLEIKKN